MENLIVASPVSVFSLFGWGFLAGTMFGFMVIMTFEWLTSLNRKPDEK